MIDAGILNNPRVDYALGLHVAGSCPRGTSASAAVRFRRPVTTSPSPSTAAAATAPSRPLCISPIQMGIDIIQSIQNFVYNCHADGDGVVLTFGQFQAGHNPNVIPETAELKGTLRTYNEEKRKRILDAIQPS